MVSHIYFDWSGTLAKSHELRRKTSRNDTCKILYSDVKTMIEYLYMSGYVLGMITNSDKDVHYLMNCLSKYGILQYFKGTILVASMKGMKEKPSTVMFKKAMELDGVNPSNAVMVGNKYDVDVEGARRAGMKTVFIDRKKEGPRGKEDCYIRNILELGLYLK